MTSSQMIPQACGDPFSECYHSDWERECVCIRIRGSETFVLHESLQMAALNLVEGLAVNFRTPWDKHLIEMAGFLFFIALASENIRCNLAFFPNVTNTQMQSRSCKHIHKPGRHRFCRRASMHVQFFTAQSCCIIDMVGTHKPAVRAMNVALHF